MPQIPPSSPPPAGPRPGARVAMLLSNAFRPDPRVAREAQELTATLHPLPGDISAVAPPDPIPNSEVKHSCADGSVAQAMQE